MPRFSSLAGFYASLSAEQEQATRRFVEFVAQRYPQLELVLAWNQPMFRIGKQYFIGFMPTKNHINLATMTQTPIDALEGQLAGYRHGKRTISLPFDWQIDASLVDRILEIRADEIGVTLDLDQST